MNESITAPCNNQIPFLKLISFLVLAASILALSAGQAHSAQVRTPFATILYENRATLKDFTTKIGCTYASGSCLGNNALLEASAGLLVSDMVETIKSLLDMHPENLKFHIQILDYPDDVKYMYQTLYGKEKDYIAFYSPENETIYVATGSLKRSVLVHEMAHAIIDSYFDKSPPVKIHELLAQYVEGEI